MGATPAALVLTSTASSVLYGFDIETPPTNPPSGIDASILKLIKNGVIGSVDEAYKTGDPVYVSANDKLLMTYDSSTYKYYVNGIMVGRVAITPPVSSSSFYIMIAMHSRSGVSGIISGLREIGFTNLATGQYNTSVGFEALPLLLGGNQNIQLKSIKIKPATLKMTKSTNIALKDAPGKKTRLHVKKQQRKSTTKRR